ncbi:putative DNA-binding protein [Alteromonadaceae bacterium 2753L.S.0a.02]|nr:putative DNA-binding protein [Alteromonadaceae bacterium 2753L.S.0a.02]
MQRLEDLQADFMAMLQGSNCPINFGPSRISSQNSKAIYRRNYRENHIAALADTFELVAKWVGENYFRELAKRYLLAFPNSSGDLNRYGANFAEFLETALLAAPGGEQLSYLPDMAHLDWARLNALLNAGGIHPTLEQLPDLHPEQQAHARLVLSPCCTLLQSRYPLYQLWMFANGENEAVDLNGPGESILICRPAHKVEIHYLDDATTRLLQLWQNNSLNDTLEIMHPEFSTADLTTLFSHCNKFASVLELRVTA